MLVGRVCFFNTNVNADNALGHFRPFHVANDQEDHFKMKFR